MLRCHWWGSPEWRTAVGSRNAGNTKELRMNRPLALVAVLAFASCGVGEQDIETHTSALSTTFHRLLHDNPPTGCDTRDYSGDGDWYPNYCKTECAAAVTGMSSSFAAAGSC